MDQYKELTEEEIIALFDLDEKEAKYKVILTLDNGIRYRFIKLVADRHEFFVEHWIDTPNDSTFECYIDDTLTYTIWVVKDHVATIEFIEVEGE